MSQTAHQFDPSILREYDIRGIVGGTVHAIAQASQGSQATLTPLGALIGEPEFGPITRAVIGTGEGALFGLGLALGLTRRS